MAWGFRRSLRIAGPLRLNFSKSGLGLSLGVPGIHVGVSPKRRPYVRAGIPGTGIYYRKTLAQPRPPHTTTPKPRALATPWMEAVQALLGGDPARCLDISSSLTPGKGPAVHIEVGDDVVVTLLPDPCGIAVIRAEALDRLGRKDEAIAIAEAAAGDGCRVAEIVALELKGHAGSPEST
jgi:uncharacterized protein DUF4236